MKAKGTTDCYVGYPVKCTEMFHKSDELELELVISICYTSKDAKVLLQK